LVFPKFIVPVDRFIALIPGRLR